MGTISTIASRLRGVFLGVFLSLTYGSNATDYKPTNFLTSFYAGYQSNSAGAVQNHFASTPLAPKFPGFVNFRLQGERGLYSPNLTHTLDFEAGFGSANGTDAFGTVYDWSIWYLRVLPLGVSYWPLQLPFVDIGINASFGVALAERLNMQRLSSGNDLNLNLKGKILPAFDLRALLRLWIIDQFAISADLGFKYHTTTFHGSGYSIKTRMNGFYFMVGATWAIGGVSGTGARLVEVLSSQQKARKELAEPLSPKTAPPADEKSKDSP